MFKRVVASQIAIAGMGVTKNDLTALSKSLGLSVLFSVYYLKSLHYFRNITATNKIYQFNTIMERNR